VKTAPGPVDVLVVYQHLPHYRYGVFKALQEDQRLRVRYCADLESKDGSIATIRPEQVDRFTRLRNVWLGPILVQVGIFRAILTHRPAVVVFLGDYRYLTTWVASVVARALRVRVLFWTQGWRMHESDATGKLDDEALRKNYQAMSEVHKAMFEASLQTRKDILAVLTPEQREQLGRGWGRR